MRSIINWVQYSDSGVCNLKSKNSSADGIVVEEAVIVFHPFACHDIPPNATSKRNHVRQELGRWGWVATRAVARVHERT